MKIASNSVNHLLITLQIMTHLYKITENCIYNSYLLFYELWQIFGIPTLRVSLLCSSSTNIRTISLTTSLRKTFYYQILKEFNFIISC